MADIKTTYKDFFGNTTLSSRFARIYPGSGVPEEAMISAILGLEENSFPKAVGKLIEGDLADGERTMKKLDQYGLTDAFWKLCDTHFAFRDRDPDLQKLIVSIYVTDFR